MELKKLIGGSSKGQLMTMLTLLLFMLMLAELFAFALLNIDSNSVVQSLTVSAASSNYGNLLKLSANNFAKGSLSKAMTTLVTYEYVPALRKVNFITNTSLYLSDLMMTGNVPNDTSGYPPVAMGNLTFLQYNKSIGSLIGFASQNVIVNETTPNIFQTDPYHIRVSYIERIILNASGNHYSYNIPVNVSLPLNNTPDLFFAQQGILRPLKFANLTNVTSLDGTGYAVSGNILNYAYGTTLSLTSSQSSGALCTSIPSPFSAQPYSSNIILVTFNAMGLDTEGCENNFAGIITYNAPSTLPTVPFLRYTDASGILKTLPSGTSVLLYGPGMDALNIEGLRSAVINNYYFASPYTPSYLQRGQASLMSQSPSGIFTFGTYNLQVGSFPGVSGNKVAVNVINVLTPASAVTVSAWIYSNKVSGDTTREIVTSTSMTPTNCASGGYALESENGATPNGYDFVICGPASQTYRTPRFTIGIGSWHMLTGTYNSSTQQLLLYVDGNLIGNTLGPSAISYSSPANIVIGEQPGNGAPFNGLISDVQIYNTSIAPAQVQKLFQEGITGLPLSDNGLIGWWPLNGNAHDYSGYNNNVTLVNGNFIPPINYTRDSIFSYVVPTPVSPLPGITCDTNAQCASNTIQQLYLGYMPLEPQNGYLETADFNGQTSFISIPGQTTSLDVTGTAISLLAWINTFGGSTDQQILGKDSASPYQYRLMLSSGRTELIFQFWNGASEVTADSSAFTALPLNNWYLAGVTYDGANVRFYLNGALVGSPVATTGTITYVATTFEIGKTFGTNYYFSGNIADAQVYGSVLSQASFNSLYSEGVTGLPLTANLVGWWPLNGNATDYSGYNNNGLSNNVIYPYFSGNYNSPGLSTISTVANEWQALGLGNT